MCWNTCRMTICLMRMSTRPSSNSTVRSSPCAVMCRPSQTRRLPTSMILEVLTSFRKSVSPPWHSRMTSAGGWAKHDEGGWTTGKPAETACKGNSRGRASRSRRYRRSSARQDESVMPSLPKGLAYLQVVPSEGTIGEDWPTGTTRLLQSMSNGRHVSTVRLRRR